jgi:hypothetical protein
MMNIKKVSLANFIYVYTVYINLYFFNKIIKMAHYSSCQVLALIDYSKQKDLYDFILSNFLYSIFIYKLSIFMQLYKLLKKKHRK